MRSRRVRYHALSRVALMALCSSAALGVIAPQSRADTVSWADSVNVLVQLAVSMRAHGRGGCLLALRHGREVHPVARRPHQYA
jgi:hypothetical protein